jgi:uncharacterized paraquat-inducible protein A
MQLRDENSTDTGCSRCGRPVVTIELDSHTLRSCSYCELRMWDNDGEPVNRAEVLAGMSEASPRTR